MNQDNELTTNLGELFKQNIKETKMGSKVETKKEEIKEVIKQVKEMDINDTYEINKEKIVTLLEFMYSGKDLGRHLSYLDRRVTSQGLVEAAWHLLTSKQESLRKFQLKLDAEYE